MKYKRRWNIGAAVNIQQHLLAAFSFYRFLQGQFSKIRFSCTRSLVIKVIAHGVNSNSSSNVLSGNAVALGESN